MDESHASPSDRRRMTVRTTISLLLLSQTITLLALGYLAFHYQLPQKAWQRFAHEKRIPYLVPSHELNRNYQASRALFETYQPIPNPIFFFGDSHVRLVSWGELLDRSDIANRGIDGDTIAGVRARLMDETAAHPAAVVLLAGTNDLLRDTPIETMKEEMATLLSDINAHWPQTPIFVLSVPPVASWKIDHQQINQRAHDFNNWLKSHLASNASLHYLDIHTKLLDPSGNLARAMTSDGVHLSAQGYRSARELLTQSLPTPAPSVSTQQSATTRSQRNE